MENQTKKKLNTMTNIKKIVIGGDYDVTIENDQEKKKTQIGIDSWQLIFCEKAKAEEFLEQLNKALEFWQFDGAGENDNE